MKFFTKRIFAVMCVMVMFVTCFSGIVMADNTVLFGLDSLGITKGFSFANKLDANITRGEFSQLVINMKGEQSVAAAMADENIFSDVAGNPYAGAINLLSSQGVVSGTGAGTFEPDRNVRYAEACKMLVKVLGYDVIVSSNSLDSYVFMAGTIGVTDNVDSSKEFITIRDMLVMIDNCLDIDKMVPMYYNTNIAPSYEIEAGNTFRSLLTKANPEGVVKLRGIVTADVSTYLYTQRNNLKETQLEVEGKVFDFGDIAPTGMVGMEVEMYVSTVENEYDKVISITATKKNTVTEMYGEDIALFGTDVIEYLVDDIKIAKVKTNTNTTYIYNNNIDDNFNPSSLDYDNVITVRAIDNNEDEIADVVFVFEYVDRKVQSVYTDREAILFTKPYNGSLTLAVDERDTKARVEFFNADGSKSTYSNIEKDDILSIASSKDGYSVRIVISKKKIQGFVEGKDDDYIIIDGTEYLYNKDIKDIRLGTNITAWINFHGEITDYEVVNASTDFAYVYAVQSPKNGFGNTKVKVILPAAVSSQTLEGAFDETTNSTSKVTNLYVYNSQSLIYYLASKVKVNGKTYSAENAATLIKNQAIRYSTDADNKIIKIDFLQPSIAYETDALTGEKKTDSNGNYIVTSETVAQRMNYNSSEKIFAKSSCNPFGVTDKTLAVCIPVADSAKGMDVVDLSDTELLNFKMELTNNTYYRVSGYEVDDETHIASFIVLGQDASSMKVGGTGTLQSGKKYVGMVKKASRIYNAETDEESIKVTMYTIGKEKALSEQTLYVSDIISDIKKFEGLSKGDLIWYSLDYFDRLDNVAIIKDFSERNTDGINKEYTDYETHTYDVYSVDFDEINSAECRWVDIVSLYSKNTGEGIAKTFNIQQASSLAPVVFIVEENGESRIGSMNDICVNDRVCVYNPSAYGYVAAVVIYR